MRKYEQILPRSTVLGKNENFNLYKNILTINGLRSRLWNEKIKRQEYGMTEKSENRQKTLVNMAEIKIRKSKSKSKSKSVFTSQKRFIAALFAYIISHA